MKSLLIFIIAFSLVAHSVSLNAQSNKGFGTKQTQGILKGILLGSTVGGVIGNQKNKSVEGILIGGTIGAVIGSETGKNQDYRRQREKEAVILSQYRAQQQFQRSLEIRQGKNRGSCNQSYQPTQNLHPYHDPEVVAARQRAEKAELELRKFEEQRRRQLEKERMLVEYQTREREAMRRLFGISH